MKEIHLFYVPDISENRELPADEAAHCLRVLRLQEGDEIVLTDGKGMFYKAEITLTDGKRCRFEVRETIPHPKEWSGHLHLAVVPTKHMNRIEWLVEKATEIGFDELTFLSCRHSRRKVINPLRMDKILISAMKQSHKAFKPLLNEMETFRQFVTRPFDGQKFIAHCYDEADVTGTAKASGGKSLDGGKPFLPDVLDAKKNALVLVGPEGDFTLDEVRLAEAFGFRPVSLGRSRLRTETAALVAVHLMNIKHSVKS